MTKAEITSIVAKESNITKEVAESVLKSVTGAIHESLKKNEEIRISRLGTFWTLETKARSGVNPRTGARIQIPAQKLPRFRAAKALRDAVKAEEKEESADDVRREVDRLCREGDIVSAFHRAMKSLLQAQRKLGGDDQRTAMFMVIVADAARLREKYYLAGRFYQRALSILERTIGPSHPEVIRCKKGLSDLEQDHQQ